MRRRWHTAAVAMLPLLIACASAPSASPPPSLAAPPLVVVALGGTETAASDLDDEDRLRSSWVQLLFREHLPRRAVLVNLALPDATVADGLANQLPDALQLEPAIVVVWLTTADVDQGTPADQYETDLRTLLGRLSDSGRARVLLAVPHHGPVGEPYEQSGKRVAAATGADIVELDSVTLPLDVAEHRVVADAFAAVLGEVP